MARNLDDHKKQDLEYEEKIAKLTKIDDHLWDYLFGGTLEYLRCDTNAKIA